MQAGQRRGGCGECHGLCRRGVRGVSGRVMRVGTGVVVAVQMVVDVTPFLLAITRAIIA